MNATTPTAATVADFASAIASARTFSQLAEIRADLKTTDLVAEDRAAVELAAHERERGIINYYVGQ